MSERSPLNNFKFGFSFPEPEAESEIETDEYDGTLVTDIEKAEIMAYAGRGYEEAVILYRKLALEALVRIGDFEPSMSNDRSFVNHHAQYCTIESQHYARQAIESSNTVKTVYTNADALYDMIQASKAGGLVYEHDEVDEYGEDFDEQLELPLETGEGVTENPEEIPSQPDETPAAA